MSCFHPIDLDETSPNALFAARSARSFASRRTMARSLARCRAACSPAAVLAAALVVLGCWALLNLTGVGAGSWQGRMCRDGMVEARSCRAVPREAAPLRAGGASRGGSRAEASS